jgi:hypothetical protein
VPLWLKMSCLPRNPRKVAAKTRVSALASGIGSQRRLRKFLPSRALCSGPLQDSLAANHTPVNGIMVQHYLEALGPALLIAAFFLIFASNWPRRRTWPRAITCVFVLAVSARYLWWRFHATVLPYPNDGFPVYWVWFLFIIELLAFTSFSLQ